MSRDALYQVEGADRLRRTLKSAGDNLADLKDVNARVGKVVVGAARPLVPQRSGRLLGSIRPAAQAARVRVLAGGRSVPYAGVIHYGWPAHGIRPQPFLSDAAVRSEPEWVDLYASELQRIADGVKGA